MLYFGQNCNFQYLSDPWVNIKYLNLITQIQTFAIQFFKDDVAVMTIVREVVLLYCF